MPADVPRPLAFVAMPFRVRPTGLEPGAGPARVDFDAIWDRAVSPALTELGYVPIRADNQAGAVIIKDMLEQLVYADLVIADITIDNANVYYEAGIRHGTQPSGCVLIGADWAQPVFDLGQIRQVRYPLPHEQLDEAGYQRIHAAIVAGVRQMDRALSPVYELTDYPDPAPAGTASSFREAAMSLSKFQQALRGARLAADKEEACARTERIVAALMDQPRPQPAVAKELLELIKDCVGWPRVAAFIEALPAEVRSDDYFVEQLQLARSKLGDAHDAIAALEQLIHVSGETPERRGLLGGRYKRLYHDERDARRKARYLDGAIDNYLRGMKLDLNEYYCACNLPRLLKARNRDDDVQRAAAIAQLTVLACERALQRRSDDRWLRPTLLGAAFDAEDLGRARALQREIDHGDHRQWQLESLLPDLRLSAGLVADEATRGELEAIIDELTTRVWVPRAQLHAALAAPLRSAPLYRKTLRIRARPAAAGEAVTTTTADGHETRNVASAGEYLVENAGNSRERYLVAPEVFTKKYRKTRDEADGRWAEYEPGGLPMHALAVDDDVLRALGKGSTFYIEAPWGTPQRVARGDYLLATPELDEIYRIGAAEFSESYAPRDGS